MGLLLDAKEKETGLKMAGLSIRIAELYGSENDTPEFQERIDKINELKELERTLEKSHCNCATRDGLLRHMRKNISYGHWGHVNIAARKFLETIADDLGLRNGNNDPSTG